MALRKRGAKTAPNVDTSEEEAPKPAKRAPAKKKAATKKAPVKKKAAAKKATRGPRKDYGYAPGAVINVTGDAAYRGKRAELMAALKKCDGKPVEKFFAAAEKILGDESPRGWLRFFVTEGVAELVSKD